MTTQEWTASLTEGDEVFVLEKRYTLAKGIVVARRKGGEAVEVEVPAWDENLLFNPRGFDKRSHVGTLLYVLPVTEAREQEWRRQQMLRRISKLNFRTFDSADLEAICSLLDTIDERGTA